jgi:hypothetical protein
MALTPTYPARLVCRVTGWPRSSLCSAGAAAADEGRLREALGSGTV